MTAAGWVIPVDKLIETGQINVEDCNVYHNIGKSFTHRTVCYIVYDDVSDFVRFLFIVACTYTYIIDTNHGFSHN